MIVSKTVKFKIVKPVTNSQIEAGLESLGIKPVRQAIVAVEGDTVILSVSYEV